MSDTEFHILNFKLVTRILLSQHIIQQMEVDSIFPIMKYFKNIKVIFNKTHYKKDYIYPITPIANI